MLFLLRHPHDVPLRNRSSVNERPHSPDWVGEFTMKAIDSSIHKSGLIMAY